MAKLGIPTEHQEQVMLCRWLDKRKVIYFAVPNGGKRHPSVARKLKAEGVKAGVPDIVIPQQARLQIKYTGVVIEIKRRQGGRTTEEQRQWLDYFKSEGWLTLVANGADEAIKKLEEWGYG